jgi:hypothetical protein
MLRLLTSLFAFLDKLFGMFRDSKLEEQGRQQTIKEANDELNRQVEVADAAIAVPDPARDERLRNRFDRSRSK